VEEKTTGFFHRHLLNYNIYYKVRHLISYIIYVEHDKCKYINCDKIIKMIRELMLNDEEVI